MKTYTKRILTWLMVIAMLTGIILTDYRAPVFSRAEEATAAQGTADGAASSSTEAGEQTGPQAEGTEGQTSPAATTQGAETQSGEQGAANALDNTDEYAVSNTQGVDITQILKDAKAIKLWNFYIQKGNDKNFIVENGEKPTGSNATVPQLTVGDELYLEYKWEIPNARENAKLGNYFDIILPDRSYLRTELGNFKIYLKDKEKTPENLIAQYKIEEVTIEDKKVVRLRTTFVNPNLYNIENLDNGIFKIWARAVKDGNDISLGKDYISEDDATVTINKKPDTPSAHKPGNFPILDDDRQLSKGAWYDRSQNNIQYMLYVNRSELQNRLKINDPDDWNEDKINTRRAEILKNPKENLCVIDEDFDKNLEFDSSNIYIHMPIFAPAYDKNNIMLNELSNTQILGGRIKKETQADGTKVFKLSNSDKVLFTIDEYNSGDKEWATYLQEIKAKNEPTIGIWKKSKLIVNFTKLPRADFTYEDSHRDLKEWISKMKTSSNEKQRITDEQATLMEKIYLNQTPIVSYQIEIRAQFKVAEVEGSVYKNKAKATWTGGSAESKEASTVIQKTEGEIGAKPFSGDIDVEKVWRGKKTDSVTIQLLKRKKLTGQSLTLSENNHWKGKFTGLAIYDADGKIEYDVQEIPTNGYKQTKVGPVHPYKYVFTNIELKEIPVKKVWNVPEGEQLPDSVTVNLLKVGSDDIIKTLTLKKGNNDQWTGVFKDVPKYDDFGNEIKYTVKEVTVSGYESKVTGDMEEGFTITNTKAKINIPVTKKWTGFDVGKGPDDVSKVEVVLWADGKPTTQKLTLSKDNQWQGRFENLDIRNSEGNSINYTVKEVEIPWYETKVEQKNATDITQGFTITNTKVPPITITVDKKWVRQEKDSSYTDLPKNHKSIPKSIEVQLIRKGVSDVEVETKELTKEGGWETTFAPVPSKDSNGNPIQYAVKEKEVVTGFALAEQVNVQNGKATLTNILTDRIVNIKIDKKWMKGNNGLTNVSETEVPVEILYRKKGSKDKFESYQSDLKIEKIKGWKLEVKGLPEIDLYGDELEYAIREVKIPSGYFGSLKPVEGKDLKFTLTNTVIPKREIKVVKKWLDEKGEVLGNEYLRIPNEVKVKLWKQVENSGWEDTGEVITLAKPNWTASFTGLDTVNHLGEQITYRIQELEGTGEFAKEFTHDGNKLEVRNDQQQVVITNKKTLDQVVIKIDKKWLDLNNSPITDQQRLPDGVKFSLFADGQFKKVIMVSRSKGWQYTERLPKFDANGKEIVYTIKEADLYGYTATIQKESGGLSFTATNKENPTPPGNPFIPPFIPDEPVPTPPNIPTPPAPNVPIDELVIEDDEVVLAGNDEEDLDDPEITDEPEDEEITDDLPRSNKDVPKTADFFMSGFANPLAVSTVIMMGYGLKKLVAKKKKD